MVKVSCFIVDLTSIQFILEHTDRTAAGNWLFTGGARAGAVRVISYCGTALSAGQPEAKHKRHTFFG